MCRPCGTKDMDVGICKLEGEVPAVRGVGRNGRLYVRIWWQVGWSEDRARVITEIEANEANLLRTCGEIEEGSHEVGMVLRRRSEAPVISGDAVRRSVQDSHADSRRVVIGMS